jgi:NitT/TauT family transport system substrate-binding protein
MRLSDDLRRDGAWDPVARSTRRAFIGRTAGAFAALSGGGALLAACGDDEQAADEEGSVQVVNILPPSLSYTAEYIADLDGYFKKEGVDVQVNTSRGSAPAIQAILTGTALLSWVGWLESVIAIADRDAPIRAVAFNGWRSPLAIVSHKDKPLRNPRDLTGERIGIPSEGGTSETTLDLLLAANDIPIDDVPRQVTGFTPGTFALIEQGRIAGFIIGASQIEQFRVAQPDAVFMETAEWVTDGLSYITSERGLDENREQIEAYLRGLKGAMEQILDDRNFANTIKKLRGKYDFPELKDDRVARGFIDYISTSWVLEGRENLLKTDPQKWQETYDAAVDVEAAESGVEVTKNVNEGLI